MRSRARNFIDEAVSLGRRLSKQKQRGRPLFVAIAGPVATGKSFFTFHLLATLKALQIGVVHLPFEIWLNSFESLPAAHPYREKFFLSRYCSDIADLHNWPADRRQIADQRAEPQNLETEVQTTARGSRWRPRSTRRDYHAWAVPAPGHAPKPMPHSGRFIEARSV
jgi:hypothetical protein